jgi:ABC-type microcin C transport system duplicated ATPase subunit YejF
MTAMSVMGLLPETARITAGRIDFAGEDLAKYTRAQMLKLPATGSA